jgi:hypothetical protein
MIDLLRSLSRLTTASIVVVAALVHGQTTPLNDTANSGVSTPTRTQPPATPRQPATTVPALIKMAATVATRRQQREYSTKLAAARQDLISLACCGTAR